MNLDDLPRQFAEVLAQERDKVEARLFAEGYDFSDLEAARELMNAVNARVAQAVRDLVPAIRDLPAKERAKAISDAAVGAVDQFFK